MIIGRIKSIHSRGPNGQRMSDRGPTLNFERRIYIYYPHEQVITAHRFCQVFLSGMNEAIFKARASKYFL